MSCILVTGASGFVGLALCAELIGRGHQVIAFDRMPPCFDCESIAAATFVAGDIRDEAALRQVLDAHPVTHIVHGAAITPDAERERAAPDDIVEVNVLGACRLMQAAAGRELARIMYLSSISAYGNAFPGGDGRLQESACPRPSALYGITKLSAELAMRRIAELNGQDLRILRLGPLFGPWEHASGARDVLSPHHQIAQAARSGSPCTLPRAVPADWLYSPEAARRIADVLLRDVVTDDVLNLGGGTVTTLEDWCAALREEIPGFTWSIDADRPTIRYNYATDRPALDNARMDAASPARSTPLTQAARETLHWLDHFAPIHANRTRQS